MSSKETLNKTAWKPIPGSWLILTSAPNCPKLEIVFKCPNNTCHVRKVTLQKISLKLLAICVPA